MTQPTLTDVFPGATQTSTTITIPKSALPDLTALADNPGDRLVAGIAKACMVYYTNVRRNGDTTAIPPVVGDKDVSIVVNLGSRLISQDFETSIEYEQQTITFDFYKLLPSSNFDPDDY